MKNATSKPEPSHPAIAVPRARLNISGGKTTEWKSRVLRNYQRRTRAAGILRPDFETARWQCATLSTGLTYDKERAINVTG